MTHADLAPPPLRAARRGASERLSPLVPLYLFCVVVPVFFELGPLYVSTLRLLLCLLVLPLGARLLLGHFGQLRATDILFFLSFLWSVLALAVTDPGRTIEQAGSTGAEFLGGYLLARAYIRSRAHFIAFCRQLCGAVLLLLPFALYEAVTGLPPLVHAIEALPGLQSVPDLDLPSRLGMNRVQNTFAHPIHYGLFCALAFSLTFVALKGEIPGIARWLACAGIALGCGLTLSSGAILALVLQIGLIAWAVALRRVRWRWWLLAALCVAAYVTVDVLSTRRPLQVFMSYATLNAQTAFWRVVIFEHAWANVLAQPVFGAGFQDWARPDWVVSDSIDNFWLTTALRYGLPGALLLALGYGHGLFRIMLRDLGGRRDLEQARLAWILSFAGLTFTLCTVHIWGHVYSLVFFTFAAGLWLLDEEDAPDGPARRQRRTTTYARKLEGPRHRRPPDATGPTRP
ncbi:MAG: O-antigen ligase family protein [Pseudomonadota bacterium]